MDLENPNENEIRKEGLSLCSVNDHIPENKKDPKTLDLSVEITKKIICNLRKRDGDGMMELKNY